MKSRTKRLARPSLACLAGIVLQTMACGGPDISGATNAIAHALEERYCVLTIPVGTTMVSRQLGFLKMFESEQLITLRTIPQGYWDSFLGNTQGLGSPFEITPTPKLLAIALPQPPAAKDEPAVLRVQVNQVRVGNIISEEEYKGPLATPGEKYRLVLGVYAIDANAATAVVGSQLSAKASGALKFRTVVRYSAFNKEWSVVAIDAGSVDRDKWFTDNVK